jgi:hypothetical protein
VSAPKRETHVRFDPGVNVAVTLWAAFMVTAQEPLPEHAPLQPEKNDPAAAVGLSVTTVPPAKLALQLPGQLMPAGELVTVPEPVPASATESVCACSVNVAVTAMAAVMETVQAPVPEQPPPLQPAKVDPTDGPAVRVTEIPFAKLALQVAPQLIPAGELVTVPPPAPALETVSVCEELLNVAGTFWAAFIVTTHVPVPEQPPPLQPAKVDPAEGNAVNVTTVAVAKLALQVAPQLMPAGKLVTVPPPVPALLTVSVWPTCMVTFVAADAMPFVTTAIVAAPSGTEAGILKLTLPAVAGATENVLRLLVPA